MIQEVIINLKDQAQRVVSPCKLSIPGAARTYTVYCYLYSQHRLAKGRCILGSNHPAVSPSSIDMGYLIHRRTAFVAEIN